MRIKIIMNIYLLEQDINNDWDTYDSMIVVAENEKEALNMHPDDVILKNGQWLDDLGSYYPKNKTWVDYSDIDKIKVTLIGMANKNIEKGVLHTSFCAG